MFTFYIVNLDVVHVISRESLIFQNMNYASYSGVYSGGLAIYDSHSDLFI